MQANFSLEFVQGIIERPLCPFCKKRTIMIIVMNWQKHLSVISELKFKCASDFPHAHWFQVSVKSPDELDRLRRYTAFMENPSFLDACFDRIDKTLQQESKP